MSNGEYARNDRRLAVPPGTEICSCDGCGTQIPKGDGVCAPCDPGPSGTCQHFVRTPPPAKSE